ncbi:6-carboxytetrahydropterin synthase QueD [bacterium]|nr:6-carboxytetrahydropterin synthase QueD [bacterium]
MRARITKAFHFHAAHYLPNVPAGHKCGRMHGHSYRVVLGLEGELDPELGWVQDYAEVKAAFASLKERFDHRVLNEIPGLENPTAELLAVYIYDQLRGDLPQLVDVTVCESETAEAIYRP